MSTTNCSHRITEIACNNKDIQKLVFRCNRFNILFTSQKLESFIVNPMA